MAKNPGNPDEGSEFNKIDLSTFEEFSFGTEWTEASGPGEGGSSDRPPRRREGGPSGRDRRPPRRFPSRDGDSRPPDGGPREGGPRRDRRGPPRDSGVRSERRPVRDYQPYESRVFEVAFYPEDHGFSALVKAMRTSCRTYELFEIARLILEKAERCVVVFRRWPDETKNRLPVAVSIPDGMPFGTEDEAIQHVMAHHLEQFFTIEEIESEPPKGVFQVVHICPVTKEIIGPPNYHRYAHMVEQHHAARVSQMSLERFRESLRSSREPEDIQAWLEKMKKATRYTSKPEVADEAGVFDSPEEARAYLMRVARDKMVKGLESARIEAKDVAKFPDTEAFRAMEGTLERQRRFPLDTANALRGRLRRENFHIFKRGSKGITYACSVRRKFRVPGQSFADSVEKLINYLEANPLTPIGALPDRYLNIPIHGDQSEAHEEIEKLPEEKKGALKKMAMDLRWLVTEGYVAEYSDGRLLAAPSESRPAPGIKVKSAAGPKGPQDDGDEPVAEPPAVLPVAAAPVTADSPPASAEPETEAAESPIPTGDPDVGKPPEEAKAASEESTEPSIAQVEPDVEIPEGATPEAGAELKEETAEPEASEAPGSPKESEAAAEEPAGEASKQVTAESGETPNPEEDKKDGV